MHPNPVFHTQDFQTNVAFARQRSFGVLAVASAKGAPLLSHIPFLLDEQGGCALLHLVRSNPIARALKKADRPARIAVSGADSYVSPDWYGIEDQVPTWNYIAVHLTGVLAIRPQAELRDLLDRQSAHFEQQLLPKVPWTSGKMSEGVMERMMRQIVPCALRIDDVAGTWKMNQNKVEDVRLRAADHIQDARLGMSTDTLAAQTRAIERTDGSESR